MSKLVTLYKAVKAVKEMKEMDAQLTGEWQFGNDMAGKIAGSMTCKEGKCSKSFNITVGEEGSECCSEATPGCCDGEATCCADDAQCCTDEVACCADDTACCKPMGKLDHMLLMLKLLERLEEKTDEAGQKRLILDLTGKDIPGACIGQMTNCLGAYLSRGSKQECCDDQCCPGFDLANIAQHSIDQIQLEVHLSPEGAPAALHMTARGSAKLKSGEDKIMGVRMGLKLL